MVAGPILPGPAIWNSSFSRRRTAGGGTHLHPFILGFSNGKAESARAANLQSFDCCWALFVLKMFALSLWSNYSTFLPLCHCHRFDSYAFPSTAKTPSLAFIFSFFPSHTSLDDSWNWSFSQPVFRSSIIALPSTFWMEYRNPPSTPHKVHHFHSESLLSSLLL